MISGPNDETLIVKTPTEMHLTFSLLMPLSRGPDKYWRKAALYSRTRILPGRLSNCYRLALREYDRRMRNNIRKRIKYEPDILDKTRDVRIHAASMELGVHGQELMSNLER